MQRPLAQVRLGFLQQDKLRAREILAQVLGRVEQFRLARPAARAGLLPR